LALIPQFSWQWGTVYIALVLMAWVFFWHHAPRVSAAPDEPSAAPASPRAPFAATYRVAGLVAFTAAYCYVALRPCWIAFFESPWPLFLRAGLFQRAPS